MGLKSVQHVGLPRGTVDKTITLNPAPANGDLMIFIGVAAAYFGPNDDSAWTGWTEHHANSSLVNATWAGPVYSKVCDGTETQITWQNPGGAPRAASCAILILDNDVTQILGQNSGGAFGWNAVDLGDAGTDTAVDPNPGAGTSWTGGLMIRCNGNVFNNDYSAETMDAAGDTVELGETWVSAIDEDPYLSTFATPMPGGTGTFDLDHTNWTTVPRYYAMNIYLETPTPTLPGGDTTGPVLQSTTPADTATDVAINSTVSATFDENLGGTPTIALSPSVTGSTNVTGATITFTPDADLDTSTAYTVTVSGIEDATGNTSGDEVFSFTTAAAAPPPPTGVLAQFTSSADATSHTIPFATTSTPGKTILAVVNATSVVTEPVGWTKAQLTPTATTDWVLLTLPAASHTVGLDDMTIDLNVARGAVAVVWEDDVDDAAGIYSLGYQKAPINAGVDWGTDVHTFTRDRAFAFFSVASGSPGGATGANPTYDNSYTAFAEAAFSTSSATEELGLWVAESPEGTASFTNNGVVGTFGTAVTTDSIGSGAFVVAMVAYDNAITGPTNPTVDENAQTGSGDTGYAPSVANGEVGFLGYAKQFSVNAGSTIDFAVDGVNAANIAIYRLGGYDFTVANQQYKRLVATVSNTGTDQSGTTPTTVDTNAYAMNWSTTASWAVPAGMASGMFVAAVQNGAGSCGAWIPFIVRNDSRNAKVVVKISDSTWGLAYNYFGDRGTEKTGASLYGSGGPLTVGTRANAVSCDRPIVTRTTVQNHWDQYELPMIQWLESNGFDVKYISCYDFDQHDPVTNDMLGEAAILIHVGHDEYWSQGMRDNALAFAQAGGHQVWLTANEVFWRVRWADAGRTMWCYKDTKQDRTDPESWTGTWRDARWEGTAPEDEVCGTFFRLNGINEETMTLAPGAHQTVPFWRDTAVSAGTGLTLPILGFEVDEVIPKTGGAILAQSDVVASGNYADDNGQFYDGSATFTWGINMFYPTSGAGVSVGFGSMDWVRYLSLAARDNPGVTNTSIRQSMANLLYDLGATADTFDPEAEGLVEPTPVALSTYGISQPAGGTNLLRFGDVTPTALKAGSTGIIRAYKGSTLAWEPQQ